MKHSGRNGGFGNLVYQEKSHRKWQTFYKPVWNCEIPPWKVLNTIYCCIWLWWHIHSHAAFHEDSACTKGSDAHGTTLPLLDCCVSLAGTAALCIDFLEKHIDHAPRGGSGAGSCRRGVWNLLRPPDCLEINLNNKANTGHTPPRAVSSF